MPTGIKYRQAIEVIFFCYYLDTITLYLVLCWAESLLETETVPERFVAVESIYVNAHVHMPLPSNRNLSCMHM